MRPKMRVTVLAATAAVALAAVPTSIPASATTEEAGKPDHRKKVHATGKFEITKWVETPYMELPEGGELSTVSTLQIFRGGIEGDGGSESQKFTREDGTSRFTGLVRVNGRLGDRSGTFVLQVQGGYDGVARSRWFVIPGSGTGELKGLRGSGGHVSTHEAWPYVTYTLNYHFE
ncbi:DUF3224 domain-containing protein [Actinomadura sp. 3N407]|uniref:DUF3224 domain-containing protein n=1 Tax=Actinomadura sp. 3N407 TaxID=3457423 RepID=UPI003FCC6A07